MKLRHLKYDTKTEEVIEYLSKRHPLYFIANKISQEQITDLINRLKFKIKQLGIVTQDMQPPSKQATIASSKSTLTSQAPSSIIIGIEAKKENKEPPGS
jgi:predicted transcriptional regulator